MNLYPELTDFSHALLDGSRVAVEGDWTVKFGVQEIETIRTLTRSLTLKLTL